jgi:hypothetical protein
MIGIIAPSQTYYIDYIIRYNLDRNNCRYISSIKDMLGLGFDYVVELENCWMDDIGLILEYSHRHGIEVRRWYENNTRI